MKGVRACCLAAALTLLAGCRQAGPVADRTASVTAPAAGRISARAATTTGTVTTGALPLPSPLPPAPTATAATPTALPTATAVPSATAIATATPAVTAPAATPSAGPPAIGAATGRQPAYLDDRSSPEALLHSYYNAIDRQEYARAYSYWQAGAAAQQLPPFAQFAQGYAGTAAVRLTLGTVGGDVGAGQLYYSVPVALASTTTGGATQAFAGCYIIHLARPELQTAPPFEPLGIESATIQAASSQADAAARLATACALQGRRPTEPLPPPGTAGPAAIDAAHYLDDRSDPAAVLRSYYNAINRQEYTRAYGYWDAGAAGAQLAPFPQFAQGYATTAAVQLATGTVAGNIGADRLTYSVPVVVTARGTAGARQTFAGCYTLKLRKPDLQVPPYQPLGIQAAAIRQVAGDANATGLLGRTCP